MSDKSLIDAIKHYQKDIERSPGNAERMLRCLKRLYVMPIKVEHLQQTGVGRSVNNLREASGEVGDAATALVAKWKAMVTAEDMVQEEESPVEEEEEEIPAEKSQTNNRISPDNDRSVKDKENIRLNHRNDKINDSSERTEKSDKSYKRSEKDSKDNKSSKHSSKDREGSSRNDSSSRNHVSSKESSRDKDKKDKDRSSEKNKESTKSEHKRSSEKHKESSKSEHKSSSEKLKESSKSEHKSSSEKDKKHRDVRDKNDSKDKDKYSSRDKEVSKEKDRKHSSSSSKDKHKDKVSSSRDRESSKKDKSRDRSRDRSRDHKAKNSKKESKRSRSHDREKESRKSEKRKHRDKDREDEKSNKRIKRERSSSNEEDGSDAGSNESSSRMSDSDNDNNHSSGDERTDHSDDEGSQSESEDASESESYSKVRIKQEPMSDCESEEESPPKKSSHKDSNHRSSSCTKPSKHKSNEEMRPPKTDDLKALIKENEKKVKKEKIEDGKNEKTKKSKTKIELNQDGSIDSGSGASFADALMGFDKTSGSPKKKKKKEEGKVKDSSSRLSTASIAASSMSGHSRSPSQCSTSSYRSTSSPAKQERKPTIHDIKEAPAALLKKPVKLEPLSLDISSTLPEISTNYKPLPSIQSRHTPTQVMSEEQMFNIMTSKNQRTKVYSGYKYGQIMAVPTLYSFCIQVLYDNIDCLEYTGGVPYEILKPLLLKLNAEQLSSLEHFNPYLVVDTDDLWMFHCKKTFPKGHRDDMESWREVYLRCMDERELKLKKLTANITESMATKGPQRQAKLAYVDSVVKPPRNVARQQVKFGTGTGSSSPAASTSSTSQAAAVQNQAKKKEIVSKAVVGGFTPATQATEQVPGFSNPSAAAKILKKKKAPLMAKALQLIKGNRFKR